MNKTKILSLILVALLVLPLSLTGNLARASILSVNTPVDLSTELQVTNTGGSAVNLRVFAVEINKEITLSLGAGGTETITLTYSPTPAANATLKTFWLNRPVTFVIEARDPSTNAVLDAKVVAMRDYPPVLSGNATYALIANINTTVIKLNLTDNDLNDNGDILSDSFGAPVFKDQLLRFSYGQVVFEVLVNGQPAIANATSYLLFDEQAPGQFFMDFPLSLIKHTFSVGDKITFKVTDYYSGKTATFDVEVVSVVPISLSLDRDTYPLPNGGAFTVHVKVTDPNVTSSTVNVDYYVELWNGTRPAALTGTATLSLTTAWTFQGSFPLNLAAVTSDLQIFTGAKLVVKYTASDGQDRVFTAYIRPSTAVLQVSKLSVKVNDTVTITLIEPDANINSAANDTVTINLAGGTAPTLTLRETGPNTGVFVGTFRIGVDAPFDNVNPNALPKTFTLSYTDEYTAATSVTYKRSASLSQTIRVEPTTAKVWVGTLTEEVTQIGPYTSITIYFEDPDYALVGTTLTLPTPIIIRTGLGDELQVTSLTRVSGNVFRATVQVEYATAPDTTDTKLQVKVPDTIMVRAVDPCSADGTPAVFLKYVAVRAWDGQLIILPAKPFYNDKDDIVIRVTDPDRNTNPDIRETVTVTFKSSSDPIGTTITLVETGPNTGVFEAPYTIDTSIYPPFLRVGDTMIFEYRDALAADGTAKVTSRVEVPLGFVTATPIRPGAPEAVKFLDIMGNEVSPKVGQPTLIQIPVSNADTTRSVTTDVIIVFYDANNVPVGLAYGRITLGAGASGTAIVGWLPNLAGTFTAKVFFWDLANKLPLSEQPLLLTVTVQ
jgi:hypothetical protein